MILITICLTLTTSSSLKGALFNDELEQVKTLLAEGADPNEICHIRRGGKDPALHFAVERNRLSMARALLEARADIEKQGWLQDTSLQRAAAFGRTEIVQYLLENNAQVNGFHCGSPIYRAASTNHGETVRTLALGGADVNSLEEGTRGHSVLHRAAGHGDVDLIHFLLSQRADVNYVDNNPRCGYNPLLYPCTVLSRILIDNQRESGR